MIPIGVYDLVPSFLLPLVVCKRMAIDDRDIENLRRNDSVTVVTVVT